MPRRDNELTAKEIDIQNGHTQSYALESVTFDEALDYFLAHCEVKNLREETLIYYERELTAFRKALEILERDTTPEVVNIDDIEAFIRYARKVANMSATSVNTRLRAVRAFFNWLHRAGHIRHNPAQQLSLLKTRQQAIQTFSNDQLRRIFNVPDLSTFTGVRNYTIFQTLLDTGVRANECVNISLADLRFNESKIFVSQPKGYKHRNVPMQAQLKRQLRKYIAIRGALETDMLFVTVDGKPLTKRQLQNIVIQCCEKARITNVKRGPHTFRHSFAKLSVQNGANVFELQQILGHTTLEMVRVYVNLFSDDVIEGHRKFSPLKNLSKGRR